MDKWIGHILRRNCHIKHVIEGKVEGRIEVTQRRGRRREQLLHDFKEKRENEGRINGLVTSCVETAI